MSTFRFSICHQRGCGAPGYVNRAGIALCIGPGRNVTRFVASADHQSISVPS